MAYEENVNQLPLSLWLQVQINSKKYPGLEWCWYEGKECFKLPWVKQGDPGWEQCYKLFHEWSNRDGKGQRDDQTVKQRFRSAINKSRHLERVGGEEKQVGSYKLYRILTAEEMASAKLLKEHKDHNVDDGLCKIIEKRMNVQQSYDMEEIEDNNYRPEYFDNSLRQPVPDYATVMPEISNHHFFPPQQLENMDYSTTNQLGKKDESATCSIPSIENLLSWLHSHSVTDDDITSCDITISYNGVKMMSQTLKHMDRGYRILYGDDGDVQKLKRIMHRDRKEMECPIIQLPKQNDLTGADPHLRQILEFSDIGIKLWYDPQSYNIYLRRYCQAQVFYIDVHSGDYMNENAVKIDKNEDREVFSYEKFTANITLNMLMRERISNNGFFFVIGVRPKPLKEGACLKGVKISVVPHGALKFIQGKNLTESMNEVCISSDQTSMEERFRSMKRCNNFR